MSIGIAYTVLYLTYLSLDYVCAFPIKVSVKNVLRKNAENYLFCIVRKPGSAKCVPCSKIICYGSAGKKALKSHLQSVGHVKVMTEMKRSESITSYACCSKTTTNLSCYVANKSVPMADQVSSQEVSFRVIVFGLQAVQNLVL